MVLFVLISVAGFSQNSNLWYRKLNRSGFIKKDGQEMLLAEKASAAQEFVNGYALIYEQEFVKSVTIRGTTYDDYDSFYKVINEKGEVIIDLTEMGIEKINSFTDGLFAAKKNGKWGYLNEQGDWVIEPKFEGDYLNNFKENRLVTFLDNEFILIDKKGNVINKNINDDFSYGKFYEGRAKASEGIPRVNLKEGFVDLSGEIIIPCIYKRVENFSEEVARVKKGEFGSWHFIDLEGNKILGLPEFEYSFISSFQNGWALVLKIGAKKAGYMNHKGEIILPAIYDYATLFVDGYAAVTMYEPAKSPKRDYHDSWMSLPKDSYGLYGIIDKEGNMILEQQYYGVPKILPGGVAIVYILEGDDKKFKALIDIEDNGRVMDRGHLMDK